jgi:Tfp pilus assembly protein PilV
MRTVRVASVRRPPGGPTRGAPDRGESLIELLLTVVILGVAVAAVAGGLATAIMMSGIHREHATAGTAVRDYAEVVQSLVGSGQYQGCASAAAYQGGAYSLLQTTASAAALAEFRDYTLAITKVGYWTGTGWQFSRSTCTSSGDKGIQQLTLMAGSADARVAEELIVVVRRP